MEENSRVVNDERMYDYFHSLLKDGLEFLEADNRDAKAGDEWKKSLTSYNFEQIYETRRVVYSDKEVHDELCMMDDILHLFQTYFFIPGIDRLLINNYGALENDIFLEYDADSGAPKKIREHYKHQYRNVYLGSLLLLEYGFLEAMTECILSSDSITASYIKSQTGGDEKKVKKVLYQSYFISAMFHDIGYPLVYFLRKAQQIHRYAPFYKIISSNIKTEFAEFRVVLAGSLLFQLVPETLIEEKYGRDDHGCLSAISFLLNFYSTGSIFTLDGIERCVVEAAALAIYKHTDYLENDYMVFEKDPLSYMVRLCDDLQEWERFLLVINDKHNYLKCLDCGSVIHSAGKKYQCECGVRYEKITEITNKKLNYISLCDHLKLFYDEKGKVLEIHFIFDYYKQIEILLDDYCAVGKKVADIDRIRQYLSYQKYIPEIRLTHNLSNNPICLIKGFLNEKGIAIKDLKEKERANQGRYAKGSKKALEFLDKIEDYIQNQSLTEKKFGKEIETDIFGYGKNAMEFVEKYMGQIHSIMKQEAE